MAIVKMKKFTLFAFEAERKRLLEELQRFGYVNFSKSDPIEEFDYLKDVEVSTVGNNYVEESTRIKWMIDYVGRFVEKEKGLSALKKGPVVYTFNELEKEANSYDYITDFNELSEISKKIDSNNQKITAIDNSIKEISPWKSIKEPIEDLNSFRKLKFIMGYLPTKSLEKFRTSIVDLKSTYFEEIDIVGRNSYCIIFTNQLEKEAVYENLRLNSFSEVNLEIKGVVSEEIQRLEVEKKILEEENSKLTDEIKKFTVNHQKMQSVYEYYQNLSLRNTVVSNFKATDKLDIIQGYIPADKENNFKELLEKLSASKVYLEIEDAKKDDPDVPIILKNNKIASLFESVTKMYALPKYDEVDPTFILSIFYWIFFGMMVADFAYGLILFVGSGIALMTLKFNDSTKKFLKFFFALSFSTMIWGLIYGSAFGDLITLPTQILDSSKDFMTVLMLSLAFGGVHLAFGLGMKAYVLIKNGNPMDAFYDVFLWYLTLTTVILVIVGKVITLPSIVNKIAFYGMIVGMLGIIAFGARESKSIAGRIAGGLYSLYGITSYIGDFVSYLRLMALGLAGGFIAVAINIIVKMLVGGGIVGIIFGVIVFVFAQLFNIFLSFLSAYVHTSRLMYVEFFSK
ncbi:V-type ATP synthase subunit I, partial [Parvimonas micra]